MLGLAIPNAWELSTQCYQHQTVACTVLFCGAVLFIKMAREGSLTLIFDTETSKSKD